LPRSYGKPGSKPGSNRNFETGVEPGKPGSNRNFGKTGKTGVGNRGRTAISGLGRLENRGRTAISGLGRL